VKPEVAAGKALRIRIDGGALIDAKIAKLPFYDAAGARQREVA